MFRRFQQVDVFSPDPFSGNPLAVVLDSEGLSTEKMQQFTHWMNLSETTFLLPPSTHDADYRVRIFTLPHELPFAGHPTLGSCHAWLRSGGEPRHEDVVVGVLALLSPALIRYRRPNDDAMVEPAATENAVDGPAATA